MSKLRRFVVLLQQQQQPLCMERLNGAHFTIRAASLTTVASTSSPAAAAEATTTGAAAAAAAAAESATAAEKPKGSWLWRMLKSSLVLASTAAVGGTAYVTYAYDVDTVEKKIADLKSSKNILTSVQANTLEKLQSTVYTSSVEAAVRVADFYIETRKNLEDQIRGIAAPSSSKLLPDLLPQEKGTFTLVLDLNETLVYSDWKIESESCCNKRFETLKAQYLAGMGAPSLKERDRGWRTFKRPGVEAFLEQLAQHYELVIYSDQLSYYVEPVLEKLDQKGCIRYRLSRDATQYINGKHLRDLEKLNRDPSHVIYLSGHAKDTTLQPENALTVKPWKLEAEDTVLLDLLPFLEFVARQRPQDIRPVLASYEGLDVPTEFRERTKELQRKMAERKQTTRLWRGRQSS